MGKGGMINGNYHWGLIGAGVGLDEPETAAQGLVMGWLIDAP